MDRAYLEKELNRLLPTSRDTIESRLEPEAVDVAFSRLRRAMMTGASSPDEFAACCYVAGEICSACNAREYRLLAGIFYAMASTIEGKAAAFAALHAASVMHLKYASEFETSMAVSLDRLARMKVEAHGPEEGPPDLMADLFRKRAISYGFACVRTFAERGSFRDKSWDTDAKLANLSIPALAKLTLPQLRELYGQLHEDGLSVALSSEERQKLAVYICWGEFLLSGFEVGVAASLEHAELLNIDVETLAEFRAAFELMDRSTPRVVEEDEEIALISDLTEAIAQPSLSPPCGMPSQPGASTAWQGPPRRLRFEYTYRIEPQYALEWDAQSGLMTFSSSVHGVASAQLVVSEDKWREFWKLLQQSKVWEWQDNYELAFEDGYQWSLELEQGALTINTQGSNANPGDGTAKAPFRLLLRALETLSRYAVPMTHDRDDH
jgi:hypothetical protein